MAEAKELITTATDALKTISQEVGPAATDAILMVYRLEVLKAFAIGIFLILITAGALWVFKSCWKSFKENVAKRSALNKLEYEDREDDHTAKLKEHKDGADIDMALMIMSGIVAAFSGFGALTYVLSPYYWMALFGNPGPMIAKRALEAAGML